MQIFTKMYHISKPNVSYNESQKVAKFNIRNYVYIIINNKIINVLTPKISSKNLFTIVIRV